MTVSSTTRKAGPLSGNGVSVAFPFAFKVFTSADVLVVLTDPDGVETEQSLTTHYSIALNADQNANPGGTITMLAAPASGYKLTATSQVQNMQPTDITNNGGFYPNVIEDALDRHAIQIQQLQEGVKRSMVMPLSADLSSFQMGEGATAAGRALRVIGFDADGNPTLLDSSDNSVLRGELASNAAGKGSELVVFRTTGESVKAALDARLPEIGTYAALRAYSGPLTAFYVRGVASIFDGGHGVFRVVAGDVTSPEDYGTMLVGADGRRWRREYNGAIFPSWFGAVGDGVTDDGIAMNRAIAHLRARIDAASFNRVAVRLNLGGKTYATTISVNATGLREGWEICNGAILGKCTGKAVLDTIGSRAGALARLLIIGDQTNRPAVGLQAARSSVSPEIYGFCDGMLFDKVFVAGWFSLAAIYTYGQEGTTYQRCKFWNSDKDAYIGIHTGYDTFPMSSDYLAPTTGSVSYINNKYIGVDYLHLPVGASATITGISKANQAVVAAAGHPFNNGDTVVIGFVNGMTQINNVKAVVANKTADTFELTGVNSSAFSTYTSGGQAVVAQTVPSVYFSRGEQHHWDTCYIVNYGSDSMVIDFPDGHQLKSVWIDALFEGAGSRSHLRFESAGTIFDFEFKTYNTHCRDSIFSVDSGTVGTVALYTPRISVANIVVSAPTLVDDATRYALYGAEVFVPSSTVLGSTTLQDRLTGSITYASTGETINLNSKYADYRDGAYTVTVTSSSGAITSYTATGYAKRYGDLVYVEAQATITNNGTGGGSVNISLPFTSASRAFLSGREYGVSGAMVNGLIGPAGSVAQCAKYDGSYPGATGAIIAISGWFRAA